MKVEQQAGNCTLEVWTDGSPLWPDLTVKQPNGEVVSVRMRARDLYDLRYCLERVMSQLGDQIAGV